MDWKLLLGDSFKEGMTDEEAQAEFGKMYIPKTEHQKEIEKQKSLIDSYSNQIADTKRKERERMSEEEKAAAERQEQWESMQKTNEQLNRNLKVRDFYDQYMERGFDKELALASATAMVDGDSATVMSNEKIYSDKREAALKSSWEKQYSINPPSGNGSGKVDYTKQIAEAQANNDMALAASLIRQQNEANKTN
jgi:hypothetical protein